MPAGKCSARVECEEDDAIVAGDRAIERVDFAVDHEAEQDLDAGDGVTPNIAGFDADVHHASHRRILGCEGDPGADVLCTDGCRLYSEQPAHESKRERDRQRDTSPTAH